MPIMRQLRATITVAALALLVATPALAQGNGKGRGNGKNNAPRTQVERERPTLQRRDGGSAPLRPRYEDRDDRRDERRVIRRERERDDRWEDRRDDRRRSDASWEDILFGRDERGRRRVPPGWCQGRGNPHNTPENCGYSSRRYDWNYNDRWGGYSSYDRAHTAFHRALDREYAARASERRSDPLYELRLRAQKAEDHRRWHERVGRGH